MMCTRQHWLSSELQLLKYPWSGRPSSRPIERHSCHSHWWCYFRFVSRISQCETVNLTLRTTNISRPLFGLNTSHDERQSSQYFNKTVFKSIADHPWALTQFLLLWPWPWSDDLDVRIWPTYPQNVLHTKNKVSRLSWVQQGLTSHSTHIIGHFGDESSQAINYTGTDNKKITN